MTTDPANSSHDQGSITLMVVIFALALFAAAGLVVDGGAKLRAARQASAIAEEAARAGAGRIDRDRAYAHGGRFIIDRTTAEEAAQAYLIANRATGTIAVVSDQKIRVTVTISKPTTFSQPSASAKSTSPRPPPPTSPKGSQRKPSSRTLRGFGASAVARKVHGVGGRSGWI